MIRLTARFSGTVQGVGFRYTTMRIARGHPSIVGSVRNLPDGCVEIVAEGERGDLDAFLLNVRERMGGYIRSVESGWTPPLGGFAGFGIG
jgi:acylphosphatase